MVLKTLFTHILNHSLEEYWRDPVPENTSLTKVICIYDKEEENKFEIIDFSNTDHLINK